MKTTITSLSLFFTAILSQAQTQSAQYDKIEVSGNVEVVYAEASSTSMRTDPETEVKTSVQNGALTIESNSRTTAKVYLTGHGLASIEASNNANVSVLNELMSAEFDLKLNSGAAFSGSIKAQKRISLTSHNGYFKGKITTGQFNANLKANSKAIFAGYANNARINATGQTLLDAGNFNASKLLVDARDFTSAKIFAQHKTNINVNDMARVTYKGNVAQARISENAIARTAQPITTIVANN